MPTNRSCKIILSKPNTGTIVRSSTLDQTIDKNASLSAHQEARYRQVSVFLADINQERTFNEQYRTNLLKIRNLVLVKFLRDTMVYPHESEHFGFYADNDTSTIVPLRESALYQKDLLGLKVMDQQSRIRFLESDTDHLRFTDQWFIDNIIPFLKD